MNVFFFDTETTGLPDWKSPSGDDCQPHLTQFAGALFRNDEHVLASVNLMVRPDGWNIPAELQELTGITEADAARFGRPEPEVYRIASSLMLQADLLVAHNISFDMRIMRIASKRYGPGDEADQLRAIDTACTMRQASKIMKMAPTDKMKAAGFTKPKPPKLEEAYRHFFDQEMQGAHNAMFDVMACRRLWLLMRDLEVAA